MSGVGSRLAPATIFIAVIVTAAAVSGPASGHGDVQPQPVDTSTLPQLDDDTWLDENPYRGDPMAIEVGETGYNQNCARCHGIAAVSGGLAPDLRYLESGAEGDEWFLELTRHGYSQNGVEKMPAFEGILSQEAMWAIRAWLETQGEAE